PLHVRRTPVADSEKDIIIAPQLADNLQRHSSIQLVQIEMFCGRVQPTPPLDRLVAVCICDALDRQQWRALRNLERLAGATIGRDRADALLRADHAYAEAAFEQAVERATPALQRFRREPLEYLAGEI